MRIIRDKIRHLPDRKKKLIYQKLRRAKVDPVYFLKRFAIIRHPMRGKIPFKLYKFQQQTVRALQENRFVSIGKSRQLGISTVVAGYCAWLLMFNKDKQISIICTKQKTAINLLKKVKLIYKQLPRWLQPSVVKNNQKSIVLSNGSQCYAQGTTQNAGRSEALSLLILDQARFIDGVQQIWKAAYPTLSTGGSGIILSTPNGINWFHRMHIRRRNDQNEFIAVDLPWYLHPQRGQKWKQQQIRNLDGQRNFRQQHQIDFQASGRSIVDLQRIRQVQQHIKKNFSPITKNPLISDLYNRIIDYVSQKGFNISRQAIQKLWIWDLPEPGILYALSCDTSTGVGEDYSTIIVWDTQTYQQIRQFKAKVKPSLFAHIIYQVRKFYYDRFVVVQRNKDGSAVNAKLQQLRYKNIYYLHKQRKDQMGLKLHVPGFETTGKSRPLIVAKMQHDFAVGDSIIKSLRIIQQLKTFVDNNGKAQHLSGYNDDLVIRFCIFRYLRNYILMRKTDWDLIGRYSSSKVQRQGSGNESSQNEFNGWII